MLLLTENAPPVPQPDDQALRDALEGLARGDTDWVALSVDPQRSTLVSAARGRRQFVLEMVDDRVRRCRPELPLEAVLGVFRDFNRGVTDWRESLFWRDVTNENLWFYVVVAAVILAGFLLALPRLVAVLRAIPPG